MKIAFLFPGQGSQFPGMGKEIYEKHQEVRQLYKKANEILNIDTEKLCFDSDAETLKKTENAQISIALTSLATLKVLKKEFTSKTGIELETGTKTEIIPQVVTGLSLGEYVALTSAGYITFEQCMKLLQKRGFYMESYIPKEEYSMAAAIGLESSKIEEICKIVQEKIGFVVPSNYNYSGQTVISGNTKAVEAASQILKERGAKKVVILKTGGPFHTAKLQKAKEEFVKELSKVKFNIKANGINVIKNIDGEYYNPKDDFAQILADHIVSPVRFDKALQKMKQEGIDTFIEIGPGKTMTGFVKKELKDLDIQCFNI